MSEPRPFNIRIFVVEGLPEGLRHVEKSNWVGLGIVCPRTRYPHVKKRAEFDSSGVYLLVGNEGDGDRPTLYIGEADCVRERLDQHHAKKDFWQQAIVFTTKGDPLNKAEVQYLEARLVEQATAAKRCKLDNANAPRRPALAESDQAEVDGYLDELLSLLPVLGVHAFAQPRAGEAGRRVLVFKGKGWDAQGYETESGFVVLAGSLARATPVPSMKQHVPSDHARRQKLIDDRVLIQEGDAHRFSIDTVFTSPSAASTVCAGMNTNGRTSWKDKDGVTLKALQEREAEA
ncbi:MAG: GIY-YIG nuclease family protein [Planctomycetes bacterium]|nr:GIY-YIG nuclease family protein [Planctomycetota bacterium]